MGEINPMSVDDTVGVIRIAPVVGVANLGANMATDDLSLWSGNATHTDDGRTPLPDPTEKQIIHKIALFTLMWKIYTQSGYNSA